MIETNPCHISQHLACWIKRMAEIKPQIVKAIKVVNDKNDQFLFMARDKKIAYIQDKQLQNFTTSDGQNLDLRQFKKGASAKNKDLKHKKPFNSEKELKEYLQKSLPGMPGEIRSLGHADE